MKMKQQKVEVEVVPEMLDFVYIEQCDDVSLLRAIYEKLLRGEYGKFPDLEHAAKKKLSALLPKKEKEPSTTMASQDEVDREKIALQNWVEAANENAMSNADSTLERRKRNHQSSCPPVRHPQLVAPRTNDKSQEERNASSTPISSDSTSKQIFRKENMTNKEYFEAWDKFDADAEADDSDEDTKTQSDIGKHDPTIEREDELHQLRERLRNDDFTSEEMKCMSVREKEKGNELFRIGEMKESIQCYSKSIILDKTNAKSFANRALAKMKCSPPDLQGAIDDCNAALDIDPEYIKAYVRRGTLLDKLGRHDEAVKDFEVADRLDTDGGYNSMAESSREKLIAQRDKMLRQNTLKIVEVDGIGEDELVNEDDFDYMEEIYTPGAIESMAQTTKASTQKSTNGFATNLKTFFSSKTVRSTEASFSTDASTDNWCRVDITHEGDAAAEESDSATATNAHKIDTVEEIKTKKTSHDSKTLCF